jgi:hypothetical protein
MTKLGWAMQNESDFVRLRDNRREGHSLRGKAYKSGLNGIKKVGREGCLTKTGSKAASSLTIPGQLTLVTYFPRKTAAFEIVLQHSLLCPIMQTYWT